eukprot:2407061-Pleurochrysis_carterae.AAC.1
MAPSTDTNALVFSTAKGTALAELIGAVRAASRASHATPKQKKSIQPALLDFTSIELAGWKLHGALTLFKGKDG